MLPLIPTYARRREYENEKTLVWAQLWLDWITRNKKETDGGFPSKSPT